MKIKKYLKTIYNFKNKFISNLDRLKILFNDNPINTLYEIIYFLNTKLPKIKGLNKKTNFLFQSSGKKNILIIDTTYPAYNKDAGSFRIFQIAKILSKKFHVVFMPKKSYINNDYSKILKNEGVECIDDKKVSIKDFLKKFGNWFKIIIVSRPKNAMIFLPLINKYCINSKIIYDNVDLHFLRLKREAKLYTQKRKFLLKASKWYYGVEKRCVKDSDQIWAISEYEKNIIDKLFHPKEIEVVPIIYPIIKKNKKFKKTKNIVFVGSFNHKPNIDAVNYMIYEIWPLINKKIDGKLVIIGSDINKANFKISDKRIILRGFVKNIEKELLEARVFVAPLRYGAGMKGKIIEAISYGIPVVTTTIGVEGINSKGRIIVADDPKTFSDSVIKLYNNKKVWNKYNKLGKELSYNFSPEKVSKKLYKILEHN